MYTILFWLLSVDGIPSDDRLNLSLLPISGAVMMLGVMWLAAQSDLARARARDRDRENSTNRPADSG